MKVVLLILLGILTEVTSKLFNKVAQNQRPSQAPYQTIDINNAEERCISICSHDTKCFSALLTRVTQMLLSVFFITPPSTIWY